MEIVKRTGHSLIYRIADPGYEATHGRSVVFSTRIETDSTKPFVTLFDGIGRINITRLEIPDLITTLQAILKENNNAP